MYYRRANNDQQMTIIEAAPNLTSIVELAGAFTGKEERLSATQRSLERLSQSDLLLGHVKSNLTALAHHLGAVVPGEP